VDFEMISKLTIVAAAVLVTSSAVLAGTAKMPKELQGHWCDYGQADRSPAVYDRGPCTGEDGFNLKVTADGFEVTDSPCKVLAVSPRKGAYRIKYKCWGEVGEMSATSTWRRVGNRLFW
jgi:hypothetical protein